MSSIKRKFVFIFLISFVIFSNIKALENIDIKSCPERKIKTLIEKSTPWGHGTTSNLYTNMKFIKKGTLKTLNGILQGFTITDKYIVLADWISDNSNTNIYILDKKNLNKKEIISDHNFGHASDLSYNSNTNKVIISNTSNRFNNKLTLFDISKEYKLKNEKDFDISEKPGAVSYDYDHNQYIVYNEIDNKIYIKDVNFNNLRNFDIINNSIDLDPTVLTNQGLSYWNDHIYITAYEKGRASIYQKSYNFFETSTNLIYVYDLYGNLDRVIYIPINKLGFNEGIKDENGNYKSHVNSSAEIESIAFYDDGTMLLGFNIYDDYYSYENNANCGGHDISHEIRFYTSESLKRDPLNIKKIEVSKKPEKMNYTQNHEKLDLTDGILKIVYADGKSDRLNLSNHKITVTGFDNSTIGKNTIHVNYAGKETTFDVNIVPKEISSINVKTIPIKINYLKNTKNLDLTGGILEIKYNDNSTDYISLTNKNIEINNFDSKNLGTNKLVINYAGKKTNFDINIIEKEISKIELKDLPLKKQYFQHYEDIDLTGGVLKITYNDDSTDEISLTNEAVYISGFDNEKLGIQEIKVKYKNKICKFSVEVIDKEILYIELEKVPLKSNYVQHLEDLDLTGGILKIIYNDDSTDNISLTNNNINISGFDNTNLGNNEIIIDYYGKKLSFNVNIIEKRISPAVIKPNIVLSANISLIESFFILINSIIISSIFKKQTDN